MYHATIFTVDKDIIISIKTVIVFFTFAVAAYLLYVLWPVFSILLISLIMVITFEHLVQSFMQISLIKGKKVPRSIAVMMVYLILAMLVAITVIIIIPPVASQGNNIKNVIESIPGEIQLPNGTSVSIDVLISYLESTTTHIFDKTLSAVSSIFVAIAVIVLSIYMSLDWENLKKRFISVMPSSIAPDVKATLKEAETSLGHWVKGQVFLMFFIGIITYIGMLVLGIEFPFALGVISGVLEVVPMIGPIIAAIIAVLVALGQSPEKALAVVIFFIVLQQAEGNILVPKVMNKVSGFSPLVILVALLIGVKIFGLIGALIAVPLTMIGFIVYKRFVKYTRNITHTNGENNHKNSTQSIR